MKAFIITFNRLLYTINLAKQLEGYGCEVIIVDNHSTYKPLLKWLKLCKYDVYPMPENYNSQVLLKSGLLNQFSDKYFIMTDCDLDISKLPDDWISILLGGLAMVPEAKKAGLSLEINDLPKNKYTKKVIEHCSRYWENRCEAHPKFFHADIASTLAVYDRDKLHLHDCIRSDRPYTARHLDWYKRKLNAEDLNYIATSTHYGWLHELQNTFNT